MKLYRILILTICVYTLISCGGADERKAAYLEKAKSSMESGEIDKARIELKNVLQIDPKDSEAYYLLGKVYEQQNNYRKAFSYYLRSEELNPEFLKNQAQLGRFYLLLANDIEKTQEKIDLILLKEPNNSDGLLLKAAVMMKKNDKSEAISITKEILLQHPEHTETATLLASIYIGDNKIEDAINVLDAAAEINQDNEKINTLLAIILVRNKDYERAESIYKKFLARNPSNSKSYNNLAAFYNVSENSAKAEETLRASIDNNPEDVNRILTFIKFIKTTKGNESAINELKGFIDKKNELGVLRSALGELYVSNGDKEMAVDTYKKAISDFSEEVTGIKSRLALASVYVSDKKYEKAKVVVDEAMSISPNDPEVNYMSAKFAVRDKNYEKAIISLRIVTKETPEKIDAFILLANVYQQEGNKEQTRSTLNSAYENNKSTPEALLKLAKYYLSKDINQAEKIIDTYNNIKESDYEGLSVKAAILNQNKKYTEAYTIAVKLIDLYPSRANGYLQAVLYLGSQEDKSGAVSLLEKGYLNVKDNRKILILLTTLQVADKEYDIVKRRIKAEISASPDDAELKVIMAKVYIYANDVMSAVPYINAAIENNPGMEEPYLLLSQIYLSRKDLNLAKSVLVKGTGNVSASIKIPLKLANLYEMEGVYTDATRVYKNVNKRHPDNLLIINNLASILSDHGNGEEDLKIAKTLVAKLKESGQPAFLDTIGWVYYKLGDYKTAIQNLTQVVEKAPKVNIFNYHLGMAYKMSGDKAQAKVFLEKSLIDSMQFKEKSLAEAALKDI